MKSSAVETSRPALTGGRLALWAFVAALCATTLAGCGEPTVPEGPRAPVTPRASLTLEPPRIGVGQVATVERIVVTPPGHTPRPFAPPGELPDLWILGHEDRPIEKDGSRWIHRTRVRVRARSVGPTFFPGGSVELEAADGSLSVLSLADLPIDVVSLLPEYPGRLTPFGPRAPPDGDRAPGGVLGPALAGALAALSVVWLVTLARRRRRRPTDPGPTAAAGTPPWETARTELAEARARALHEPFAAAHAIARATSRYASRRFATGAAGLTTEELAASEPPFSARSRWPELVALLASLDELRFLPESDLTARAALAERLPRAFERAESFVEDSIPPGVRR